MQQPGAIHHRPCAVCGVQSKSRVLAAREMMFGLRHPFSYAECPACGSLQLLDPPVDMAPYYPENYPSFQPDPPDAEQNRGMKRLLGSLLIDSALPGTGMLAALLKERYPLGNWARICGARRDDAILDVGCGHGSLLRRMHRWGFTNLSGIDPFAREEIDQPGLRTRRLELAALAERYDLIMLHHVLEHVADPVTTLAQARERLLPGGRMLVRFPLAASEAAQRYGTDWFQLDAPRHLVIPSLRGFVRLADRAGLDIRHQEFDGTALTFEMSEYYRQDVPLVAVKDLEERVKRSTFWPLARQLNRTEKADSGVFVLVPKAA